jgi:hypothetical protein
MTPRQLHMTFLYTTGGRKEPFSRRPPFAGHDGGSIRQPLWNSAQKQ